MADSNGDVEDRGDSPQPAAAEPQPMPLPQVFDADAYAFPWPPDERGLLDAFARTWTESVFHPTRFFQAMPRDGTIGSALLYFLPIGVAGAAIQLFWRSLLITFGGSEIARRFGLESGVSGLVEFLFSPLILLGVLFVTAAVVHVLLFLLQDGAGGMRTTVRVLAFAQGPTLFSIVPGLGDAVGAVWIIVLAIIGLREAHRAPTWKPLLAVLLPLLLLAGLLLVAVIFGGMLKGIGELPVS